MRKTDHPRLRRVRAGGRHSTSPTLPEPVYRDFVGTLFEMGLPVFGMGLVFVGVALIAAQALHDPFVTILAAIGAVVTAWRLGTIARFRRVAVGIDLPGLRRWERCYAAGSYALALLLALLNIRALGQHHAAFHLVTVSLVFGYGAGVVARISVRPRISVTSMLVATVPTIAALLAHAAGDAAVTAHFQIFAVEAFLMSVVTALSVQTVFHIYRTAARHRITEHDMTQLARRDALTGLGNRLHLRERFDDMRAALGDPGTKLALLCLDLDGFKPVNDKLGHPAGDLLLGEVARRLEANVRSGDVVVRLGGDEFVILQPGVAHAGEAELLGRRIIRALGRSYDFGGGPVWISASVGVALETGRRADLEQLLAEADTALYRAKAEGKGRVRLFAAAKAPAGKKMAA